MFFRAPPLLASLMAIAFLLSHAEADDYIYPRIAEHGKVVRLPAAEHQPRAGSRVVVDLTRGGKSTELNPGIEKVARFVNIYAGAGKESAEVKIAVVLHGDATLVGLKDPVYAKHFGDRKNPNLALIHELENQGVEFFVCGQSLAGKGVPAEDLDKSIHHAVSALTALVNLQADGYAYLPL